MERYEYWTHTQSGEHYLVRLDRDAHITGVCGPMLQAQIPMENRHNYDYDCEPQHAEWLQSHTAEFHTLAPEAASSGGAVDAPAGSAQAKEENTNAYNANTPYIVLR